MGGTAYEHRYLELLDEALEGNPETIGAVVGDGDAILALVLFGPVAGSVAWNIDALLFAADAAAREIGGPLLEFVAGRVRAAGRAMLIAELPADPVVGRGITVLRANRFRQVGRIPDFFREDVALLFLRRMV